MNARQEFPALARFAASGEGNETQIRAELADLLDAHDDARYERDIDKRCIASLNASLREVRDGDTRLHPGGKP